MMFRSLMFSTAFLNLAQPPLVEGLFSVVEGRSVHCRMSSIPGFLSLFLASRNNPQSNKNFKIAPLMARYSLRTKSPLIEHHCMPSPLLGLLFPLVNLVVSYSCLRTRFRSHFLSEALWILWAGCRERQVRHLLPSQDLRACAKTQESR